MGTEIDSLEIRISASADSATKSIDKILARLDKLEDALGIAGTASVSGFSKLAANAEKLNSRISALSGGIKGLGTSTINLSASLTKTYATVRTLASGFNFLEDSIKASMAAIETSNFYNVSLDKIGEEFGGQFANFGYESADAYIDSFSDRLNDLNKKLTGYTVGSAGELLLGDSAGLGLDVELMQRFQAKTLSVTNAIGLLGETSINTTKAMSMLVGDIASLTNTDIETVMTNFSSGLIGQSRSLYKYGLDITNNTLQQYALAEGIQKSLSEMTQAEKMQLRVLAILDQAEVAYSDLANTLGSVANQSRITGQQTENLSRTLGNLFLPVVKNVLPYVNGMIIAMNNLFTSLGFEIYGDTWLSDLQDGITGGVTSGVEDLEDSMEDATDTANKLKKSLSSFDELEVLNAGSLGIGVADGASGVIDLTDSITSALNDYESQWEQAFALAENKAADFAEKLEIGLKGVAEAAERIAPAIAGIGTAFTAYKVASGLTNFISALSTLASPAGVAFLAIGAIGGVAYAISDMNKELKDADLADRFGTISLGLKDIEEVAKKIIDNASLEKVSTLLTELENTSEVETKIKSVISELDKYNWKVSVGMELTEEEEGAYKQAISDYVEEVNNYVTQQHYAATLGIQLFLSNSETSANVQSVVDSFYNQQSRKLAELGKQLNEVTTAAWNDGLLTIDEVETITNIQQQMANVQEQLTTSEFKARMQLLEMDFSGAELTPESYEELQKRRQELTDQYIESYNESLVFTLAQVNLAFQAKLDEASTQEAINKVKKEWDNAIKDIMAGRDLQVSQMMLQSLSFDYNTIVDTFGESLNAAYSGIEKEMSWIIAQISNGDGEFLRIDLESLLDKIVKKFKKEAGRAGKDNFGEILALMTPTSEIEKTAQSLYESTGKIPQSMADALAGQYALESVNGSISSLFKFLYISASDSEERQEVLGYMTEIGIDVPEFIAEGVAENGKTATNSITDLLENLEDSLLDSELPETAEQLGKDTAEGILSGYGQLSRLMNDGTIPNLAEKFGLVTGPAEEAKISIDNVSKSLENLANKEIDVPIKLNLSGLLNKSIFNMPLRAYSVGGFPEDGLFMANHGELVGKFSNGKTAVANNEQIVEGIKRGVYEAVTSAMQSSQSSTNVNVTLEGDAKGLFRAVRNQANEYFYANGQSAFKY